MILSQRLLDHEREGKALDEALRPYVRVLTRFKFEEGGREELPLDFNAAAPLPDKLARNLYFGHFEVSKYAPGGENCVAFFFTYYGKFGMFTIPIEWVNLPLVEFHAKLRWQHFKDVEHKRMIASAMRAEELERQKQEYVRLKALF
jgi:hypothetical protein